MASLNSIRKVAPGAETVAGRVIAFHQGKHVDLGQYVGDGQVILSPAGEALLAPPEDKPVEKSKRRMAENINVRPAGGAGLDLSNLEV